MSSLHKLGNGLRRRLQTYPNGRTTGVIEMTLEWLITDTLPAFIESWDNARGRAFVGKARMMRHLLCVGLLLLFTAARPRVFGGQAPGVRASTSPGVKTDRAVYPEPPLPRLPKAGGTFSDPTFGTRIMRVTDEADGRFCNNAYSYWPSFNQNSTRFFIWCGDKPMLYRFHPDAFKISGKEPLFQKKAPSRYTPRWEDAIWSGTDPDVLFCHEGLNLWGYNVATRTYRLVKNFAAELPPGHLRQMSRSLDDNVFAFSLQDPQWKVTGFLAYRRDRDRMVLKQDARQGLDEVQLDKTGRYLVIKTGMQGKGRIEVRVADLKTGKMEELTDNQPDFAPGHSDNGRGTIVGADNWKNRITFRKLSTPHQFHSLLDLRSDWSQDYHISMLANREGWALVSFYVGNNLPSSGVFRNEILLVRIDGSQRVIRLAHHRTVYREYWDSPRANISRDGRFAVFTSNWGGSNRRDVFILKVP